MTSFNAGWYLLYTRPKQEKRVAESLADNHVSYYLPLQSATRVWADRVKVVRVPMFPSYVFVNLKSQAEYFEGLNADGVLQYVKFGGQNARVSDLVINDLKLVAEHGTNVEVSFSRFEQGQKLTIADGPFSGMHCEVIRYNNKDKILVRFDLLQRSILMEVPQNKLVSI